MTKLIMIQSEMPRQPARSATRGQTNERSRRAVPFQPSICGYLAAYTRCSPVHRCLYRLLLRHRRLAWRLGGDDLCADSHGVVCGTYSGSSAIDSTNLGRSIIDRSLDSGLGDTAVAGIYAGAGYGQAPLPVPSNYHRPQRAGIKTTGGGCLVDITASLRFRLCPYPFGHQPYGAVRVYYVPRQACQYTGALEGNRTPNLTLRHRVVLSELNYQGTCHYKSCSSHTTTNLVREGQSPRLTHQD